MPPLNSLHSLLRPIEQQKLSDFDQFRLDAASNNVDEFGEDTPPREWNGGPQAEQPVWEEPDVLSEPLAPGRLFISERFEQATQTLRQQMLESAGAEVENGGMRAGLDPVKMLANGYRPFYALGSDGKAITQTIGGAVGRKVVWHRPGDLRSMDGGWRQVGDLEALSEGGMVALSSQGEPLVSSIGQGGSMLSASAVNPNSIEPRTVVQWADNYVFKLVNAKGKFVRGSDGSGRILLYKSTPGFVEKRLQVQESWKDYWEEQSTRGSVVSPPDQPRPAWTQTHPPFPTHLPSPTPQPDPTRSNQDSNISK
ncbi:hypothetical protein LTR17_026075 [Elasticomyces elasticus]|nr:hypothetical protein LTR17_026075 [Elasticomyces elasticus]